MGDGGKTKDSITATRMTVTSTEVGGTGGQGFELGAAKRKQSLPPVPTSSFQFQADWKQLKGNQSMLVQYFKVCIKLMWTYIVCIYCHLI